LGYFSKLFFIAHLLAGPAANASGAGAVAGAGATAVTIKFKSGAVFGACLKVK